ncbi:MAG TPA: RNA helicase, partial [Roseomonas sp.]
MMGKDMAPGDSESASGHSAEAEAAIEAARLRIEPVERKALLRLIERRLPADAEGVRQALCEVRRRGWAARLTDLARQAGRLWITSADLRAAVAAVTDPEASDETLLTALDREVASRLRGAGPSPEAALQAVVAEIADAGGSPSPEALAELALAVAAAHGLDADTAHRFRTKAVQAEERRRRELKEAERAARERRREEVRRLREWEKGLVEFEDLPGLLHCTPKEAQRWVAAGIIPVARRLPAGRGGRGERRQFDLAVLTSLQQEIPGWRNAEREAARDGRPAPGQRGGDLPAPQIHGSRAANAAVARIAALDRYAGHFATARALDRHITLVTGPTNSGKSHTALDRLARAESGQALAPLRLLAHEFREALGSRGIAASLSTGEERIHIPGSRHLAATVEMCPFNDPVDVAIVDEAQMLYDPDRGAAWTAAIMGVPAR